MHVAKSVLLAVQQQPFVVARAHASSLLGRIASRVARQETLATVTPLLLATGGSRNCWNAVLSSSSTWTSSSLLLLHSMPSKLRTSSFSTISTTTKTIYSARSLAIAETTRRRIHPNMARLYARRILELAAASAAAHVAVVQLEKSSTRKEPPVNWHNWRDGGGREWSTELLQVLGANAWTRWWAATRRIVTLSCLVLPYTCVLLPLSLCSTTLHDLSWQYALWGIEQAGPTYIKLVQWATTRHDLFSPEFCKTFSKLQDRTEGHSWQQTLDILSQDWNLPPPTTTTSSLLQSPTDTANVFQQKSTDLISKSKVLVATTNKTTTESANATANANDVIDINSYLSMDREPVGSGCIAQVYHGTLRQAVGNVPAGTEVAVKVQHPDIWHKVCVDFFIMGIVAQWLEALPYANLKYLSLVDSVRKFRNIMLPQLDLTIEASNLARFNRDFSADPTVTFPQPINELTTPRVLLETFVHGTPILQYARNAPEAERKELALMGLNTTLKMIFLHDFLHGDLHPGNILVSRDKSVTGHPLRLHLLDCGLVVEMGPDQHVNLVKILGSFARRNGRLAGQLMVDTSSDCQASDIDVELFVKGIEHIVSDDEENNFLEKVGDYITDICFLACQRKVKLEASFINAALAVEIMEGIATKLYPDLKVAKVAMPLVVQAELMHRLPKFSLW